jgi:hypothetical protein
MQSPADPYRSAVLKKISDSAFALGGQGRGAAEADAVLHLRLRLQGEDHQRDADRPRACRDHQVSLFFVSAGLQDVALIVMDSVADLGCLSRIPDPNFFHPGSA